jgi:hypothetical protein
LVPRTGLEPVREKLPTDFKSVASAYSATPALFWASPKNVRILLGSIRPFFGKNMVGKTGFEPATPWSQAKYSTKLSYFPLDAEMREGGGETKRRGRFASPSNPFTSERWRALRDSNSRPFDS